MDAPQAPDPKATAAAQGQMNKETAIAQANLNNYDQYTPQGSLKYDVIGTNSDGTPKYQATQTYSPENQKLYDNYMKLAGQMGGIGNTLAGNVAQTQGQPFKMGNEATEARLMELGSKRLDPLLARRREGTESDLINRGVRPGSEAYERMMGNVGEQENDAYNQLLLTGRGQAAQESLAERNQPLNEMMALLGGTQVQQPNMVNTPQTSVSGVDYAGLVSNNYNQQVGANNAMWGGIAGLGGSALGGWGKAGFPMPSDRRLKKDIERVGTLANGLPVYLYTMKGGATPMLGLMADEVRAVRPDAVVKVGGFDHVRYDMAVI